MNTKQTSKIKLPYSWNKKIQRMADCSPGTVTKVIQDGNTKHAVWAAYEQLLQAAVVQKQREDLRKAEAEKLRTQLAA
jgi:hypothetical protein